MCLGIVKLNCLTADAAVLRNMAADFWDTASTRAGHACHSPQPLLLIVFCTSAAVLQSLSLIVRVAAGH